MSAATYAYETTGRLSSVSDGIDTFTYGYEPNSNLLASLTAPQHTVAYTYEINRNVMIIVDNKLSGATTPVSSYAYTYDTLGRRADREQSGSAIAQTNQDTFAYNARSEVEGSTNDVLTAAEYTPSYNYDQIGNRKTATGGALSSASASYTSNVLNQYTAIDGTGQTYDLDGNLLSNGTWTYTLNGENRLKSATNGTTTSIDFTYDYQGRLVKKDDGTNIEVCVYDGWNRIATFDLQTSNLTLQTSYTWALDLSGSMQGAGGVGGLLKKGAYYPLFDANGNVMQKLDGTAATVMNVDYDPFGNIISGQLLGEYGFSTKPLIDGLDWYYYGYRYYDAETGRWLSRDPIAENGGLDLYGMVGNNLIDRWDYLGLIDCRCLMDRRLIPAGADEDAYFERFKEGYDAAINANERDFHRSMNFLEGLGSDSSIEQYILSASDIQNLVSWGVQAGKLSGDSTVSDFIDFANSTESAVDSLKNISERRFKPISDSERSPARKFETTNGRFIFRQGAHTTITRVNAVDADLGSLTIKDYIEVASGVSNLADVPFAALDVASRADMQIKVIRNVGIPRYPLTPSEFEQVRLLQRESRETERDFFRRKSGIMERLSPNNIPYLDGFDRGIKARREGRTDLCD